MTKIRIDLVSGLVPAALILAAVLAVPATGWPGVAVAETSPSSGGEVKEGLPNAVSWSEVPVQDVALETAPAMHEAITGDAVVTMIAVQTARIDDVAYVRLQWTDDGADTEIASPDDFADGVAVQFPLNGNSDTPILMGDAEQPVTIWYWNAKQGQAQDLFAYGYGTLAPMDEQSVQAAGEYANGQWTVVFQAPVSSAAEGVNLTEADGIPAAFAVWEGANSERDGFKAVSLEWHNLKF